MIQRHIQAEDQYGSSQAEAGVGLGVVHGEQPKVSRAKMSFLFIWFT